jgi:co-chaperonin GroES (HSP10)
MSEQNGEQRAVKTTHWTTKPVNPELVQYAGLQAINDKLIIRVDPDEKQSAGGIWLHPAGTFTRPQLLTGTVLSVGPRVAGLKPGARVMFDKSHGWPIPSEPGEELLGMRDDMIQCEVEE